MKNEQMLTVLMARIPELEWQLHKIAVKFSSFTLPAGLFRTAELTVNACMAEIKSDIQLIAASQTSNRLAYYLAEKIQQKINVLVNLCKRQNNAELTEERPYFAFDQLMTKKQRVTSLEQKIAILSEQKQAMSETIEQKHALKDMQAVMHLKSELGEIEKKLTLAREAYAKATE